MQMGEKRRKRGERRGCRGEGERDRARGGEGEERRRRRGCGRDGVASSSV